MWLSIRSGGGGGMSSGLVAENDADGLGAVAPTVNASLRRRANRRTYRRPNGGGCASRFLGSSGAVFRSDRRAAGTAATREVVVTPTVSTGRETESRLVRETKRITTGFRGRLEEKHAVVKEIAATSGSSAVRDRPTARVPRERVCRQWEKREGREKIVPAFAYTYAHVLLYVKYFRRYANMDDAFEREKPTAKKKPRRTRRE